MLAGLGAFATVGIEVMLLGRELYMLWLVPVLVVCVALGIVALALSRRFAGPALVFTVGVLLVAPTAYSATTWSVPVEGTFPAAGPKANPGEGGYGVDARTIAVNLALIRYVESHHPGRRFAVLTVASDTAAPIILLGHDAASLGGYSGIDPALDGPGLARLVRSGQARYVLLGGVYRPVAEISPRRRRCAAAWSCPPPSGTAPTPTPAGSSCSTAPGAQGRWKRISLPCASRRHGELAVERPREQLALAAGGPTRDGRLAVGDQAQMHRSVFDRDARAADELVPRALEVLGEPQQHRASIEPLRVALPEQRRQGAGDGHALAVVAGGLGETTAVSTGV